MSAEAFVPGDMHGSVARKRKYAQMVAPMVAPTPPPSPHTLEAMIKKTLNDFTALKKALECKDFKERLRTLKEVKQSMINS